MSIFSHSYLFTIFIWFRETIKLRPSDAVAFIVLSVFYLALIYKSYSEMFDKLINNTQIF